jgi:hypothetical protein
MNRVSMKELEFLAKQINEACGTPTECWTKQPDGTFKANIGCYHLAGAYSGYALECIHNESGGVVTVLGGFMPKRELAGKMRAFLHGIHTAIAA